jgi:hypothetical protein
MRSVDSDTLQGSMVAKVVRIFVATLFVGTACAAEPGAVHECEALLETYCRALQRCFETISGQSDAAYYEGCITNSLDQVACEDADAIGTTYDQCLAELAELQCEGSEFVRTLEPPRTCIGVIRLR